VSQKHKHIEMLSDSLQSLLHRICPAAQNELLLPN